MEGQVKASVSRGISNAIACNEGATRQPKLSALCRGPRSKGHTTPPLLTTVPQNLKKSHHPAKNSPAERAREMEDQVKALVSRVFSNAIARNERPIREATLSPLDRGPRSKGCKTSPLLTAVPENLKKSQHSSKKKPCSHCQGHRRPSKGLHLQGH